MSLWTMAWRYVWSRPAITILTLIGIALGAALICSVLTLKREVENAFAEESGLFDLVVGAKGSPLQLVLSSVYHIDSPTGNIPYSLFEELESDFRVDMAIPLGLGDNYQNFRIIGSNLSMFAVAPRTSDEDEPASIFQVAEGRLFKDDFEAVIGHDVARSTGLSLGDTFYGTHGLASIAGSEEHQEFPYTVVGVLEPTGMSNDRAIFTTLSSVWAVHAKEEAAHDRLRQGEEAEEAEITKENAEVTAILLRFHAPGIRMFLANDINRNTEAMAAVPINEMLRLFQNVLAPIEKTLLFVAYLVAVVASLTVIATLYQSTERRRRDLAILRTLGAHSWEVGLIVLFEALLLTAIGIIAGWLLAHGALSFAEPLLRERIGVSVQAWGIQTAEIQALGLVALFGVVAGLIPAMLIYRRTPVNDLTDS